MADEFYEQRRRGGDDEEERVPDAIRDFVQALQKQVQAKDTYEIQALYEGEFAELTERYYKASAWPSPEAVSPLVDDDETFMPLYRELYFRHVYEKLDADVHDRVDSYRNYVQLFESFLALNTEEPEVELPEQWLWDIVDEFTYQFQSYHEFRADTASARSLEDDEAQLLRENQDIWTAPAVFRVLHALAAKAQLDLTRPLTAAVEDGGAEDGAEGAESVGTFFHILGRYALVGLLRVNVLVGDYAGALAALNPVSLREKRSVFTHVPSCHAALYYNLGFVYLMLRRYVDASKTFTSLLLFATRNKGSVSRVFQDPETVKTIENMYGLLALSHSLAPQRLDESISMALRERYGDALFRMQSGGLDAYDEVFGQCAPKFICVLPPFGAAGEAAGAAAQAAAADAGEDEAAAGAAGQAAAKAGDDKESGRAAGAAEAALLQQKKVFLTEVQQRARLPDIVSYLKMCTSVDVGKLAGMMEMDEEACMTLLLALRHKTSLLRWSGGCPGSGEYAATTDVSFTIDRSVVHVKENRAPRRYGEYFIRNIVKLDDLILDIRD